jgi:hypothetical protein
MTDHGVLTMFFFSGATIVLLAISPIGRALAERIRGGPPERGPGLEDGIRELRREVAELAERVDFVERLSAARGAPPVLPR